MSYKAYLIGLPGLISLWPLDELSGSVANDIKGSLDGSYVGSPTFADRVLGYGSPPNVLLNNAPYVTVPDTPVRQWTSHEGASGVISVIVSCYQTARSGAQMLVTKSISGPGGTEWQIRVENDGSVLWDLAVINGEHAVMQVTSAAGSLPLNTPVLIIATYDRANSRCKIYVQNVVSSSTSTNGVTSSSEVPLQIGRRGDGGGTLWQGDVGLVGIVDRELSSDEANIIYQAFISNIVRMTQRIGIQL